MKEFCIYYPSGGMGLNKSCKVGRMFDSLPNKLHAPCFSDEVTGCEFAAYPSSSEIAARDKMISDFVDNINRFSRKETDICPHCQKQVTSLRQVGRCVYGSCGCRMWQGQIPAAWKTPA